MALGVQWSLEGGRALQSILEKATPLLRQQIGRANRETASAIQSRAQSNAPRRTGDLANNISSQPLGRTGTGWSVGVLDVIIPSRGGRNSAHLNPSVYGVWYEFGFVTRKIAAHPFMRPAVDAERPAWDARMTAVAQALEQQLGAG